MSLLRRRRISLGRRGRGRRAGRRGQTAAARPAPLGRTRPKARTTASARPPVHRQLEIHLRRHRRKEARHMHHAVRFDLRQQRKLRLDHRHPGQVDVVAALLGARSPASRAARVRPENPASRGRATPIDLRGLRRRRLLLRLLLGCGRVLFRRGRLRLRCTGSPLAVAAMPPAKARAPLAVVP